MINGGKAVARALLAGGVDHAFWVPGESFLGLLDARYDTPQIRVIATRHEGGIATALATVDIAAIARALGADGITVRDEREFGPLLQDALRSQKPTVLHLHVDPEQLSVTRDIA